MLALLQRVSHARVEVAGEVVGQIGPGLLVLVGVHPGDGPAQATRMAERLLGYRVFADTEGRMNRSLVDTGGGLLVAVADEDGLGAQGVARQLQQIVPEARLRIGHGQMAEGELEDVMMKFIRHEADILVCTTIIESGLDIPNANTLIIHRADMFGLAQLYQLRGRIGRALIAIRDHPIAATAMGINLPVFKSMTFGVSAGITGLAGALEVAGPIGQLTPYVPAGYGFAAIIVAFVGRLHPVGIVFSALLMSMFYIGGELAQSRLGLPKSLTGVFQGLLLFTLLACDTLIHYRITLRRAAPSGG